MTQISRRNLITRAGALAAATALPAPAVVRAQEPFTAKWATATPGLTVAFYDYIRDNKLDQKHGLRFPEPILNTSIATLFNDFVADSYELMIASWDPFLTRYQ